MSSFPSHVLGKLAGQTPLVEQSTNNKNSVDSFNDEKTLAQGIVGHGASIVQSTNQSSSTSQTSSASSTSQKPKGNICPRCSKPVYFAEEVKAIGQSFHKLCYRCANCKKSINGANFSEHDGNLYDNNCYQRLFGPKGVGFGVGAGTLSTDY
ncbi:unnamed protein product [Adineta steineri]|uniref:Cysteine-rich protein 1 n=1 Tax=Adineta steineri TaxID=433720 RepID=A0A815LG25_9BILA|nr:unnamed protein product [Adineta steineri]CAF1409476.1 unnamed protein product [Adineta steineri]CAF3772916.1 unnamed protein product [Adineta steineri]CAF4009963.1 unnamed protein product [Adineta steineri]